MNDKMTPSGDGGDNNHKRPKNRQSIVIFLTFMLVSFLALNFIQNFMKDASSKEITYDAFIDMLNEEGGGYRADLEDHAENPAHGKCGDHVLYRQDG